MTGSAKQSIARLRRFAPRNDRNCLRPKGCDGQVRSAIHGGQVGPIVPRDETGNQDAAAIFEMLKTNATPPSTILRCINGGCIRNRRAGVCAQVVIA
jgi:hypothetical protein